MGTLHTFLILFILRAPLGYATDSLGVEKKKQARALMNGNGRHARISNSIANRSAESEK
jgi:hypothetical protein